MMLKVQNKHLLLNAPTPVRQKLLKFCYFMMCALLLACKGESSTNENQKSTMAEETEEAKPQPARGKTILCFGDSITAGYGLDDINDAYPAVLQQKIDASGLDYTVINSGLSGETTAGGKSRISWILNQNIDIFLLELGANDGLRGVTLSETHSNLQAIIDAVKKKNPKTEIILAGMELPPNMGQDYTTAFRTVFADLAKANHVEFIPFILKDVGGIPRLNQADGIHPTAEGHKIIADTVWEVLQPML